jgi:hypothetical protein
MHAVAKKIQAAEPARPEPREAPAPRPSRRVEAVAAPIFTAVAFLLLGAIELWLRGAVPITGQSVLTTVSGISFAALLVVPLLAAGLVISLTRLEAFARRHASLMWTLFRLGWLFTYASVVWWTLNRAGLPFVRFDALPNVVYHGGYVALLGLAVAYVRVRRGGPSRLHPSVHLVLVGAMAYWFHVESSYNIGNRVRTYYAHLATAGIAGLLVLAAVTVALCRRSRRGPLVPVTIGGAIAIVGLAATFPWQWHGSFAVRHQLIAGSFAGRNAARLVWPLLENGGLETLVRRAEPASVEALGPFSDDPGRTALAGALAATRPRNVLLVSVDTLRRERLTEKRPHLARLAREGVVFDRYYTTAPLTRPALRSILLGSYPMRTDGTSLVEIFDGAGYHTFHVSTFPNLTRDPAVRRGFDVIDESLLALFNAPASAPQVTDAAIAHLQTAGDAPFFGWVHYLDPHAPYDGPGDGTRGRYEGEIDRIDVEVGRLLEALTAAGKLDATLIVFVADHGEEFLEHGGRYHGRTLYDEVLHVPLILRAPGGKVSGVVHAPTSAVDLGPTILGIVGLERPAGYAPNGADALTAPADRVLFGRMKERLSSVRRGRWKLIVEPKFAAAELYDLETDPRERNNLVDDRRDIVASLARDLQAVLKTTP